jgi:predicted enzyme related to lactoylglutathione lyase
MGEGMDYWMIETTGRGPSDLGGGMYLKQGYEADKPKFYIGVEDIDGHTERFKQAGGAVLIEKQEVPGFGWSVIGKDPEGNVIGLFQAMQSRPQTARTTTATKRKSSPSKAKKKTVKSSKKRKK